MEAGISVSRMLSRQLRMRPKRLVCSGPFCAVVTTPRMPWPGCRRFVRRASCGATSTIHEHDVAAIAALALLDADAVHAGHSYVLTGPQSLSQRDKLRIIGEAIGKAVPWQEIAPEQFRQALLAQGCQQMCPTA